MGDWSEKSQQLKEILRLRTEPIAFKKLDSQRELDDIPNVTRLGRGCTFCQIPFMVRVAGMTLGFAPDDKMNERCKRIHGLLPADEGSMKAEAKSLARTWMPSFEEAMKQQQDYPRVPPGGAIIVAPLAQEKFEPDVILVYGNPAQLMMLMCGLQKVKYQRFKFHFIGEGACVDSIGQCYASGEPSLAIPCYGERSMGQVADDEIVMALPPGSMEQALQGLSTLATIGFKYPISSIGPFFDPNPLLAAYYPERKKAK